MRSLWGERSPSKTAASPCRLKRGSERSTDATPPPSAVYVVDHGSDPSMSGKWPKTPSAAAHV